jgi:hypothetical protein
MSGAAFDYLAKRIGIADEKVTPGSQGKFTMTVKVSDFFEVR